MRNAILPTRYSTFFEISICLSFSLYRLKSDDLQFLLFPHFPVHKKKYDKLPLGIKLCKMESKQYLCLSSWDWNTRKDEFTFQRRVICLIFFDSHIFVAYSFKVVRKRKCWNYCALYIRLESFKRIVLGGFKTDVYVKYNLIELIFLFFKFIMSWAMKI